MSKAPLSRYLLVLCTTIAMIVATSVYARHELVNPHHGQGHCDLCVHLGGAAGTPVSVGALGKTLPVTWQVPSARELVLPPWHRDGLRLPRGPPSSC